MKLEELIKVSISEFLEVEVHRDTETLDLSSKIEIVQKRMVDKIKTRPNMGSTDGRSTYYEYEMFFSSNPNDMIKIDGWIPIETARIGKLDKIEQYIDMGILRKIELTYNTY